MPATGALLAMAAGLCASAHADVVLKEQVSVQGSGLMSFANMSGTSTMSISGKRARSDSDLQMQSRWVRMFARAAGPTSTIILLDADRLYEIDSKKRQYRELSLSEQRQQLQKAMAAASDEQASGGQAAPQPAPTGMDESQCEWSDPKVEVKRTGRTATVAGFTAQQLTIVARQSCKDRKSSAVCDVALALDEWLAPSFDLGDEARQFNLAYAKQLGIASAADESMSRAQMFFARYQGAWSKVMEQMHEVKGYPVKSSFALGFGGPACHDQGGSDGASEPASAPAASPSALGAQIAGALFAHQKKAEPASAAAPEGAIPGLEDLIVPVRVDSQLLSASKESLPADTFQPPAGFRKVGG
jgi:hypothetical protein